MPGEDPIRIYCCRKQAVLIQAPVQHGGHSTFKIMELPDKSAGKMCSLNTVTEHSAVLLFSQNMKYVRRQRYKIIRSWLSFEHVTFVPK